jgi:prolyl oligopeptidase
MKYKFENATLDGTEVFLDPNTLSEDGTSAVSGNSWSEDGMFMAYQVKKAGSDWATIYVRDAKAT